jgi:hypothetical protein
MSDASRDILAEAAHHARRLIAELERRRIDLARSTARGVSEAPMCGGQKALDGTLAAARQTLAAVERELLNDDHPSESVSTA